MAGRATRRHHSQPPTWKFCAARRNSAGIAVAPAITLNRMYHWVPRIINGLSHRFGLSRQVTIPYTTSGNNKFAGKAARNCAIGCTHCATRGLRPIHTPIGTHTKLASAIKTITRAKVSNPRNPTSRSSARLVPDHSACPNLRSASAPPARSSVSHSASRAHESRARRAPAGARTAGRVGRAQLVQRTAALNVTVRPLISRERRSMVNAQECAGSAPGSCSTRKRSTQAIIGRNRSWS